MPLVSILTPTYRHARFIEACVRSMQGQGHGDWEQIVVDDGSDDGTADLAEAASDGRTRVIRQANRGLEGLGETYNRALAEAKGSLIAVCEGDDFWPADKLERQIPMLDGGAAFSYGRFQIVDAEGKPVAEGPPGLPAPAERENQPTGRAALALADPHFGTFAWPVTWMIRREALSGFHQHPGLPLVDHPTLMALSLAGPWAYSDAVLGCWRRHGESTTKSRAPMILSGVMRSSRAFLDEHRAALPLTDAELDALRQRRANFQHERAMIAHRWALAEGKREQAAAFLRAAGSMPLGGTAKARVAACRFLMSLGLSTEPAASFQRGPWREMARINEHDFLVSPDMDAADLTVT
jgi:hypothetical protein